MASTHVLTASEMRDADSRAIHDLNNPSLSLMEKAASRVVEILRRRQTPASTLVVCGKGNNGGDGLAVARLLKNAGWNVKALLIGKAEELKADPAENWSRALAANVPCVEDVDGSQLDVHLNGCELVVDALFGTGLAKPLTGIFSAVVQKINRSGKEVLSVDVPSGLISDSGVIPGPAIRANTTVVLAAIKYCHLLSPACKMSGRIHVVDIDIPSESTTSVVRSKDVRALLPFRSLDSHKGSFGHCIVVGGSIGKSGAAYLAGRSALRCGAGLVTVACPAPVRSEIASHGPEIMTLAADDSSDLLLFLMDKTSVAIGPGMGTTDDARQLFQLVVGQFQGPLVIDADGLNHLARELTLLDRRKPSSTVLTPHPGEMARLMTTNTKAIQEDRSGMAKKLASSTGSIVVLKGYRTIVAHPAGRTWIVLTGGPALASGGTGDILTGIIAGFLSQGLKPIEAALAGVYLHGLTANLFEAEYPQQNLNALDILNWWNDAVHLVRSGQDVESEYLKIHFEF